MTGVTFKHCPFCGKQAVLSEYRDANRTLRYAIECLHCPCEMNGFTSKEQALDIWNKRKIIVESNFEFQKVKELTIEEISWDA